MKKITAFVLTLIIAGARAGAAIIQKLLPIKIVQL